MPRSREANRLPPGETCKQMRVIFTDQTYADWTTAKKGTYPFRDTRNPGRVAGGRMSLSYDLNRTSSLVVLISCDGTLLKRDAMWILRPRGWTLGHEPSVCPSHVTGAWASSRRMRCQSGTVLARWEGALNQLADHHASVEDCLRAVGGVGEVGGGGVDAEVVVEGREDVLHVHRARGG